MKYPSFLPVVPLLAALLVGGCVVSNDDYDEAKRQRDEERDQLQEVRLQNDILNKDIVRAYSEVTELTNQLALNSAILINKDLLTELATPQKARSRPRGSSGSGTSN